MKRIIFPIIVASLLIAGANLIDAKNFRNSTSSHKEVDAIVEHASYAYYSLEDLSNGAEIVLEGTVKDISSPRWNNERNRKPETITGSDTIYKDSILIVNSVYKGVIPEVETVKVRTFGGKTEDFEIINEPDIKFNVGEKVVVFLIPDNTIYNKDKEKGHYILLGALQGAYKVSDDEISNIHGKMKLNDFELKVQSHIKNPRPIDKSLVSEE